MLITQMLSGSYNLICTCIVCVAFVFEMAYEFIVQEFRGQRKSIGCFSQVYRSLAKVIGAELHVIMLYQEHQHKWLAMLKNILSGKATFPGGKDAPACLTLFPMKLVVLSLSMSQLYQTCTLFCHSMLQLYGRYAHLCDLQRYSTHVKMTE